ncbi:rubrerythrin [Clostridium polynesiense]|uniref:rubrerythrin n=1 Tax=Clostridium polynesiense TaxID=1325933 RepID=UPI00058E5E1B|nr:ferritin family protein [Clostridium polynesiense]
MDKKSLKGTQTEKNLFKTFAGESRARNRYNLYSEKARMEGYEWIGDIFDETAGNEYAHAREVYRRFLGLVGNTSENLKDAIKGETEEYSKIYKEFEEVARREGFKEIADFYKEIAEVEEFHEKRFKALYDKVNCKTVFTSPVPIKWQCLNCGYIYEGTEAPAACPLCKFPRAFFKPLCEEF